MCDWIEYLTGISLWIGPELREFLGRRDPEEVTIDDCPRSGVKERRLIGCHYSRERNLQCIEMCFRVFDEGPRTGASAKPNRASVNVERLNVRIQRQTGIGAPTI